MGRYVDFSAITRAALTTAGSMLRLELSDPAARHLMDAYLVLEPFPDAMDTLTRLRGRKLAILSNGSPAMLDAVVRHAQFDRLLDAVLSVDALRIFKPHPSVYAYAAERLQTSAGAIGFVSSNFWDVAGATSFGFRTFWINRARTAPDDLGCRPAAVLSQLPIYPPCSSDGLCHRSLNSVRFSDRDTACFWATLRPANSTMRTCSRRNSPACESTPIYARHERLRDRMLPSVYGNRMEFAPVIQERRSATLAEDIGSGDVTARLGCPRTRLPMHTLSPAKRRCCAAAPGFDEVFAKSTQRRGVNWHANDGDRVSPDQALC